MTTAGLQRLIGKYERMLGRERVKPAPATAADLAAIGITVIEETPEGGETA
jgi:hypothetical protein